MMAADACTEGAACALRAFASVWKDVIPLVGAVIIATTAATVAFLATWRLNKVMKQTEVFLKFTERYHNIMLAKHQLELRSESADGTAKLGDEKREKEAYELYRQYFGLMFDEFFAYSRGFLAPDLFVEWMMWRNHEYQTLKDKPNFSIANVSYKDGWQRERDNFPAFRSEFAAFFEEILNADARPKHLKRAIEKIVTSYGSRSQRIRKWLANLVLDYWILWIVIAVAIAMKAW